MFCRARTSPPPGFVSPPAWPACSWLRSFRHMRVVLLPKACFRSGPRIEACGQDPARDCSIGAERERRERDCHRTAGSERALRCRSAGISLSRERGDHGRQVLHGREAVASPVPPQSTSCGGPPPDCHFVLALRPAGRDDGPNESGNGLQECACVARSRPRSTVLGLAG